MKKSLISYPDSYAWALLARAYGDLNEVANYNYASAEYSFRIRAYSVARKQIENALEANPSPQIRLKLEDLRTRLELSQLDRSA